MNIKAEMSSPDMLTYFHILPSVNVRPLTPMSNDRLDLQECLEHGRTAKVSNPVSVCMCVSVLIIVWFLIF